MRCAAVRLALPLRALTSPDRGIGRAACGQLAGEGASPSRVAALGAVAAVAVDE